MATIRDMAAQYTLLDLHIDVAARSVQRAGCLLEVTGLSFDLLACLITRGTAVVSFDELMTAVWAPAVVNEETITQRVRLLRQGLGDDSRRPRYIRSVRGRGYQLMAAPQTARGAGECSRADTDARMAAADSPFVWQGVGKEATLPAPEQSPSPTADPGTIATDLMRVRAARWVSLVACVTAALIAIAVFSRSTYHRRIPFAELPERPAVTVGSDLLERARYYASIGQGPNNERAIRLYEQALREKPALTTAELGLSFAYSSRVCLYDFSQVWLDRAESLARSVLRSEPHNALAYSALGYAEDCRGYIDTAIAYYEQALQLDPRDRQDSLASVANLYQVKGRLVEALRINLALNPYAGRFRYVDIQTARTLELLGFTAQAERLFAHSFRLYPDNVFSNVAWPQFLMAHGRLVEAKAALDEALARGTDRYDLQLLGGELALLRGDRRAAVQAFERAREMRSTSSFAETLALVYADQPPAPAVLRARIEATRRGIDAGDRWPVSWLEIVVLQNALGDWPGAIDALGRAVEAGFLDRAYLESSPLFRPLQAEPGFAQIISIITSRVGAQRQAVLAAGWGRREALLGVDVAPRL